MPLKHKVEKIEDVEEPFRTLYEPAPNGGVGFFLQVEGMVPKTTLDEFRNNNITLTNEVSTLKKQYEGVDVAKYREMLASAGKTPTEIEAAVQARVQQLNEQHSTVVTELTTKNQTLTQQLSSVLVDGTLKTEAAKAGVLVTALDDVVLRGRMVYSTDDKGGLIAKDNKGQPLYDVDGTSPLAVGAWLKGLKKSAPHLFEGMRGGGAPGSDGGGLNGRDTSKMSAVDKISAGLDSMGSGGM